ncbi:MAG TPA: hypothetical protein VLK29_09755, partial [Luteimonas sp.]|nr:hypothetical protein [Luteimonas sp.]
MSRAEVRHTLGLLAMDGAILSSLAGPMDILRVAQKLAQIRDPATPLRLETFLVGAVARPKVSTATGLDVGP